MSVVQTKQKIRLADGTLATRALHKIAPGVVADAPESGGLAPNTIVHADWAEIPAGSLNPAIILQSEVLPQASFPGSGRYAITVVNLTDVAVDAAFFNYEDLGAFWEDTEPHAVQAGILHFPVGGSLENSYTDLCPAGFLYCQGLESIINPGTGLVQGRVEVRLQGASASGGVVGFVIRAV